jgi:hypothetical protein
MQIKKGTKMSKLWDGEPFEGNVVEISKAESTLYPGQERTVFKVHYPADNTKQDLEDEEIRKLLVINHLEVRAGCRTTRAREHAQLSGTRLRACSHTQTRAHTHTHTHAQAPTNAKSSMAVAGARLWRSRLPLRRHGRPHLRPRVPTPAAEEVLGAVPVVVVVVVVVVAAKVAVLQFLAHGRGRRPRGRSSPWASLFSRKTSALWRATSARAAAWRYVCWDRVLLL